MAAEPVEATVVEEPQAVAPSTAVVPHVGQALTVTPDVQASELVARLGVIRDAMRHAMTEGVDYGRIPGVDKPSLFKPGAEKLNVLFQLDIQIDNQKTWDGDHLTVISHATVYHAPSGTRLGYGEGLCTTKERRYAKRRAERTCPACGKPAIIKGKAEYGGGWVCWKKKDGCNANYRDGDPAIEGQEAGDIDNPDLPDLWNTVIKMGEKRARVDAVLAVTGASALFTQDVEDAGPAAEEERPPAQTTPAAAAPTAREPQATRPAASVAQRKLIFAKAKEKDMDNDRLRELLQHVAGTVHTDRIARDDVDAVLAAIAES
jgi:hypothetical protein